MICSGSVALALFIIWYFKRAATIDSLLTVNDILVGVDAEPIIISRHTDETKAILDTTKYVGIWLYHGHGLSVSPDLIVELDTKRVKRILRNNGNVQPQVGDDLIYVMNKTGVAFFELWDTKSAIPYIAMDLDKREKLQKEHATSFTGVLYGARRVGPINEDFTFWCETGKVVRYLVTHDRAMNW